nr:hypothetical protein MACL_00001044 [Theileria orientalis]
MGARQSHLNIFLKSNETTYSGDGYTVTVSKAVVSQSINYDVVTHTIKYDVGKGTNFDIYIYDNEKTVSNASYVFAYCSPGVESHVVKEVKAYYSILLPMIPLVISFVREKNDTYDCGIDKLESAGWDWAKNITTYSGPNLKSQLEEAFKHFLWKRTIGFDQESKKTNEVIVFPRKIDTKNYRLIFIPSGNNSFLEINCLFTFDTKLARGSDYSVIQVGCKSSGNGINNQVDPYFLDSVRKKTGYFDGIIVYFAREQDNDKVSLDENHNANTAILLEFISNSTKTHIQRKDKLGTYWEEKQVNYTTYASLTEELNKIKTSALGNDVNTIIMDSKSYIGVKVNPENTQISYNKYTHEFSEAKDLNIIFERISITIGSFTPTSFKSKKVEVYYLKYNTEKNGPKDDDRPFLIAIYKDDEVKREKVFHFTIEKDYKDKTIDYFKEWKELNVEKFDDRIKRIDGQTVCTGELHYRKKLVYHILTNDEAKPPPDPPKPTVPVRPGVDPDPVQPPPGPDWWLIIGCSVGAFLFIVALAIGYAIYWYNTTIRLLTYLFIASISW